MPKCSALRTDREPCGQWAARGSNVCRYHGAGAPQVKTAAKRRLAEQEAHKAAAKYVPANSAELDDPVSALLKVAAEVTAFKDYLGERIAQLSADEYRYDHRAGEQLRAEIALYERALDRTAKVLTDIGKLGLVERQVRIQEAQALLVLSVLQNVLGDLGLTPAQQALAATVIPARLREIESPNGEPARLVGRGTPEPLVRAR